MTNTREEVAVADAIRDAIKDYAGGHSLSNSKGELLWHTTGTMNLNHIAKAAIAASNSQYLPQLVAALNFYASGLHYTEFFEMPNDVKVTHINDRGEKAEEALNNLPPEMRNE